MWAVLPWDKVVDRILGVSAGWPCLGRLMEISRDPQSMSALGTVCSSMEARGGKGTGKRTNFETSDFSIHLSREVQSIFVQGPASEERNSSKFYPFEADPSDQIHQGESEHNPGMQGSG